MPEPRDMTDRQIKERYEQTNGRPGNPIADALLAEIKRRSLDL